MAYLLRQPTHLGDWAWKLNLARAAFIWKNKQVIQCFVKNSESVQIKSKMPNFN